VIGGREDFQANQVKTAVTVRTEPMVSREIRGFRERKGSPALPVVKDHQEHQDHQGPEDQLAPRVQPVRQVNVVSAGYRENRDSRE